MVPVVGPDRPTRSPTCFPPPNGPRQTPGPSFFPLTSLAAAVHRGPGLRPALARPHLTWPGPRVSSRPQQAAPWLIRSQTLSGLRLPEQDRFPLANGAASHRATAVLIGPRLPTAAAPHAGHVDFPAEGGLANQNGWKEGGNKSGDGYFLRVRGGAPGARGF